MARNRSEPTLFNHVGWKEEKLQPGGGIFLLTSPLIEPTGYLPPECRDPVQTRINIDEDDVPTIQE